MNDVLKLLDKRIEYVKDEIEETEEEIEEARGLFAEHLFVYTANKLKDIPRTEFQMKNAKIAMQREMEALPPLLEELARLEELRRYLHSEAGTKVLAALHQELFPNPGAAEDAH